MGWSAYGLSRARRYHLELNRLYSLDSLEDLRQSCPDLGFCEPSKIFIECRNLRRKLHWSSILQSQFIEKGFKKTKFLTQCGFTDVFYLLEQSFIEVRVWGNLWPTFLPQCKTNRWRLSQRIMADLAHAEGRWAATACTLEHVVTNRGHSLCMLACRYGDVGLPSTRLAPSLRWQLPYGAVTGSTSLLYLALLFIHCGVHFNRDCGTDSTMLFGTRTLCYQMQ